MAQFTRTKKLTDSGYSPTLAISEATRRAEVDGSIQEISDILYSTDVGKGASQVGISGGLAYADVQAMAVALSTSGSGTIPPNGSVGNAQLATDVKVGSLAASTTVDKSNVIAITNEINAKFSIPKTTTYTLASNFVKSDTALADVTGLAFPVVNGKSYLVRFLASYQSDTTTTGIKLFAYLPSGAGTIAGNMNISQDIDSASTSRFLPLYAIGASGLTGSGFTTSGVTQINQNIAIFSDFVFKCTSTGELRIQYASDIATTTRLNAGAVLLVEIL